MIIKSFVKKITTSQKMFIKSLGTFVGTLTDILKWQSLFLHKRNKNHDEIFSDFLNFRFFIYVIFWFLIFVLQNFCRKRRIRSWEGGQSLFVNLQVLRCGMRSNRNKYNFSFVINQSKFFLRLNIFFDQFYLLIRELN